MRTIAITGSTGFAGQRLIRALTGKDFTMRVLVRDREKFKLLDNSKVSVELIEGDLASFDALEALCKGSDVVIHLAGAIAARSEVEFMKANGDGTKNLVVAARRAGSRRLIHISSLGARKPTLSGYTASKAAGEQAVRDEAGNELAWVIVRPPAVYGPGDKATLPLLKALMQRYAVLPGRADARFSMIYVDDLADAVIALIDDDSFDGSIVEPDDGATNGYSWPELVRIASQMTGHPAKPVMLPQFVLNLVAFVGAITARLTGAVPMVTRGKVRELYHTDWVCRQRAFQETGSWRPKVEFAGGLKKTVDWYKDHKWL